MSLTPTQARDEIHAQFRTAWLANGTSSPISVYYDDDKADQITATSWARFTMRHNTSTQRTLAEPTNRRFTRLGLIFVQLFTPLGDGQKLADQLAAIAQNAFEGQSTQGGVWFRNVRINEVGPSGAWFQTNVVAEFEYDEVK